MTSIWIELAKAAIDLVRIVVWPFAVVLLALKFKPELKDVLSSLSRRQFQLKAPGVEATVHAAEQLQTAAENPSTEKLSVTPSSLDPSPRLAVNLLETRLRDELKAIDPERRDAVLLRSFAETRLVQGHEFIYNRIFGSQIAFLKRLNEVPRLTVDEAHEFFKPYADKFPQIYNTYSFDAWLNFMTSMAIVVRNENNLKISEFGRDFLVYIINQRLLENKPW